jgi:hypothetical protein
MTHNDKLLAFCHIAKYPSNDSLNAFAALKVVTLLPYSVPGLRIQKIRRL